MSRAYKFLNKAGLYFVTFAIVDWTDIFLQVAATQPTLQTCEGEKNTKLADTKDYHNIDVK